MRILCCNSGSSSLKLAIYDGERQVWEGASDRIGQPGHAQSHRDALLVLLEQAGACDAAGHRIVHGGPDLTAPVRINPGVLGQLRAAEPFAPLHVRTEIEVIEALQERLPSLLQVACFDTAFHRRLPERTLRLPLPREYWDRGVRRYGFHGLSYEYILDALGEEARGRVVIAHLGSGASLAAVQDGQPVDTTMGLTPTGGLLMGTRTGDLDPGVLLYLLRSGLSVEGLAELVDKRSGLLGISGEVSDMRALLASDTAAARLAVEMFCYTASKHIGALTAALGGLDTLVFTGGIGEHATPVRSRICGFFDYLGLLLDEDANQRHHRVISVPKSRVTVRVEPTHETLMIARHTRRLLCS